MSRSEMMICSRPAEARVAQQAHDLEEETLLTAHPVHRSVRELLVDGVDVEADRR